MRRVEKPIKCLPVWYPEDGIELLASWPIRMLERLSSTNERPADGSVILSWSSKTLTQVIDLISSRGWFLLDVCWVTEFLHAFQSPVTVCREPLSWPGTVSLPRGAPSCDESSSGTSQNKYLLSPSWHGLRGQRTDTQTGTLPGVMGAIMIAECVTGLTNPIAVSICLSA